MKIQKIRLIIFIALFGIFSNLAVFSKLLPVSPSLAATSDSQKADAERFLKTGIQQFQSNQIAAALNSWQQALTIYREIKDRSGEGQALGNLGFAYVFLKDYSQALNYLQQWLTITQETQNRQSEILALGNLGTVYISLQDYPQAINYFQQALTIAKEINSRQTAEFSLINLGTAYFFLRDYPQAIKYQQQALTLAQELKNRQQEGEAYNHLGMTYFALGDYTKTIEYQQHYLSISQELKNRQGEGKALGNLGNAYFAIGDYLQAIEYQQKWLAIAQEIKDRPSEVKALAGLGNAYISIQKYREAIKYHQQSLAIAQEIKDRQSEAKALGSLGLIAFSLGYYPEAIRYEQEWLIIAREIKDRQSEGRALGSLGLAAFALGDYSQAIDYQQQSLAIARATKNPQDEGEALNNLGLTFYKSGNFATAEKHLLDGIKVYESLRDGLGANDNKISLIEKQATAYRTLQQVLIAQNQTYAALEVAERGRARAFIELVANRLSGNSQQPIAIPLPQIAEIKQIAQAQNATLVEYSIVYDYFKVDNTQDWYESELYIWLVKPTGEVTFRQVDLKPLWQKKKTSLSELVFFNRSSMGVRGLPLRSIAVEPLSPEELQKLQGSESENLHQLHQVLIQPVADLLPTNPQEPVIFIPQGSLFLVPFPALQDADGKYLIEKHTVLTAPSIQVLALTRQQRQKIESRQGQKKEFLVVGNPTMPKIKTDGGKDEIQLPPLPGAEAEAKAIAPLLNTQALTGNQATKLAILPLMPKAQIIHLATHGLLDDVRGIGSAIALAPSAQDSGLLTAEEILDLKLNAELVVLSACDTGRGKITGDGVVGLSRSLITAGVPSVLVSLWSVDDNSTKELMTEFYSQINQRPNKAQALRAAMLTTMKKHPQPKYWAAFTLIGEAE
jgi:CHAT domain-containing protein/tetratricopeptide (TPR) repeat protein